MVSLMCCNESIRSTMIPMVGTVWLASGGAPLDYGRKHSERKTKRA